MNNSININNIISLIKPSDIKQTISLDNITSELAKAINTQRYGMLEVLANSDGVEFFLQLGETSFPVELKGNISLPLPIGEKIAIPVKISPTGVMTPETPKQDNMSSLPQPEIVIESKDAWLNKPQLSPIKLQNFIAESTKDTPLDNKTKQQIIQIAKDIEVSIAKIGSLPEKSIDIKNLQNTIKEIIANPQKIDILKPQLEEIIQSFSGKQLGGEISNKINQLYIVKTPIGDTCFASDIEIPLAEKLTLDINVAKSSLEQKIKIVDDIIKNILPSHKTTANIETMLKDTSFKHLIDLFQNTDTKTMNLLLPKLPFQSDNLFENIYNLYKGSLNNDITRWLGTEVVKEIISDNVAGQKIVTELNNMMQSFVKETPSWRIVEVPFFDGSQLSAIKIALKKDQQQKEKQKDGKTTRFVVETEFSKLGKFQFDGFSKVQSRSLDLIIRTSTKLSDDFCSNIINLFKKSLYDLNYSGTIKINTSENFIKLQEDNIKSEGVYI